MNHALKIYRILRICIVLASTLTFANAATYYVRQGSSGNGSDWDNAYGSLPATLQRGATYYVAAGSYPSHSFNDAESGTTLITIKKATAEDHGTEDGWEDFYAGQAIFAADWVFHKGYYQIDGQKRNDADWQQIEAYGIKISIGAGTRTNDLIGAIMIPDRVTSVSIRRVAMSGPGCAYGQVSGRGINIASANAFKISLRQCLIRNTAVPILTRGVTGMLVDQCWIGPNYPIYDGYHCEAWSDTNSHEVVISNNRFVDIMNTAFITVLTSVGPMVHRNWKIYGNVFMHSPVSGWNGWGVGNGIIAVINNNTATGWRVYNNTIVGVRGWFASIDLPGTDNAVYNNLWYHLGINPQGNPTGTGITANSKSSNWLFLDNGAGIHPTFNGADTVTGSSDPFVDWAHGDLRLNPDATGALPLDRGLMLDANYNNVDPAGIVRGADGGWDIGAFERPGAAYMTPPTQPTALHPVSSTQSRIVIAWEPPIDSPVLVRVYRVFRNGIAIGSTDSLTYSDAFLHPLTTYHYDVRAESYAGILSEPGEGIDASTLDTDRQAPTAPPGLLGEVLSSCDIQLSWGASTDNQRVAGYKVYRNGQLMAVLEDSAASYYQTDLNPSSEYVYDVTAFDDAGNESPGYLARAELSTLDLPPLMSGLVAHYEFDDGYGTVLRDKTAMCNDGTIRFDDGPAWRPGKTGLSLEFNGKGDLVEIPCSGSLDLWDGMTLMAWVYPRQPLSGWQHVIAKENDGVTLAYYLAASAAHTNEPWSGFSIENNWLSAGGGQPLPPDTWTHIASTYDGRNLRVYVNGSRVACYYIGRAIECTAGALHLGGNNLNEFFSGLIDQVFIYNRALAPDEVRLIYKLMGGSISGTKEWMLYN